MHISLRASIIIVAAVYALGRTLHALWRTRHDTTGVEIMQLGKRRRRGLDGSKNVAISATTWRIPALYKLPL